MMEFQSCFDLTGLFSKENTYALHPEVAQWPLMFQVITTTILLWFGTYRGPYY